MPDFSPNSDAAAAAIAALRWWRDAGVADALSDHPQSWLVAPPAPITDREIDPAAETAGRSSAAPAPKPFFKSTPAAPASDLSHIGSLDALKQAAAEFEGCALKRTATQLVFSDGNPQARVMLIGEAPGADEDRVGRPFVGQAGQLLDRMLASIGLDRTSVYITNTVFWRPPGNRTPTTDEVLSCLPFTHRQIELVNPQVLVALGGVPFQSLVNTNEGITRARGQWRTIKVGAASYQLLPTLHPAYVLRVPAQKASSWQDMLAMRTALDVDLKLARV